MSYFTYKKKIDAHVWPNAPKCCRKIANGLDIPNYK